MSNQMSIKSKSGEAKDYNFNLVIDLMTNNEKIKPNYFPKDKSINSFGETVDALVTGNKRPFKEFWESKESYFRKMLEYGTIGTINNLFGIEFQNYFLQLDNKEEFINKLGIKTVFTEYQGNWWKLKEDSAEQIKDIKKPAILEVRESDLPNYEFIGKK